MSFPAKKRLVLVFLVLFALWPLGHRWLVAQYQISPWRLFGWAMYTTPRLDPRVDFYSVANGERSPLRYPDNDTAFSVPQRRLVKAVWGYSPRQRFVTRRGALGRFERPDVLADVLFQVHPEVSEVLIVVLQPVFRAGPASFEVMASEYGYRRPRS